MVDGVIIQCRLLSSRLRHKALLSVNGRSILARTIQRAKVSGLPVFVATSNGSEDDVIEIEALRNGVQGVYRGKLEDVRGRYFDAARKFQLDRIARVTADNPFTEPTFITRGFRELDKGARYTRCNPTLCPEGTNVEVFLLDELAQSISADAHLKDQYDIEHVTPNLRRRTITSNSFVEYEPESESIQNLADFSLTIDTLTDYHKILFLCSLIEPKILDFNSKKLMSIVATTISENKKSDILKPGHSHV